MHFTHREGAYCEIVSRRSNYVTFWYVGEDKVKVYKFSDFATLYPNNAERDLDLQQHSIMIAKVKANDPFIKRTN